MRRHAVVSMINASCQGCNTITLAGYHLLSQDTLEKLDSIDSRVTARIMTIDARK
jgi:hypothetical protein